jgi:hypothetical protein
VSPARLRFVGEERRTYEASKNLVQYTWHYYVAEREANARRTGEHFPLRVDRALLDSARYFQGRINRRGRSGRYNFL